MVTAKFRCHLCLQGRTSFQVRERSEQEGPVEYVRMVVAVAAEVHKSLSPYCTATKVDLYVPYDVESGTVGKENTHGDG